MFYHRYPFLCLAFVIKSKTKIIAIYVMILYNIWFSQMYYPLIVLNYLN